MTQLFTLPKQIQVQSNGTPLGQAKLYFYEATTLVQQNVYTTSALNVAHTQPVQADSAGVFPTIYLNPNASFDYRVQLKTSADVLVYDEDNVPRSEAAFVLAFITQSFIGGILYPRTDAEIAASLTPVNYFYPEGHVYRYGTNTSPGTTDMTSAFQAAAKLLNPYAPSAAVKITGQINLIANQQWRLDGTVINIASSTLTVFSAVTVDDWSIVGPFRINGDGSTVGTAKGIFVQDCKRWRVVDPTLRSIRGYGIYLDPGSSTTNNGDHGTIENPRIEACYVGYQDVPGTGTEYCTILNPYVTLCTVVGIATGAGNINFIGGHCLNNVGDGLQISSGANHAHGIISGMQINHNTGYGIHCNQIVNGQTFANCHIYQNSVWLEFCKGIQFDGGHIDATVYNYKNGSSGLNYIRNMYCPGGYGFVRGVGSNNGHDQLIITDCFGAGIFATAGDALDNSGVNMNDVSLLHVYATRDATSTQSLTSGVAADLKFNTETFDHRGAYDPSTGVMTVPTGFGGQYRVKANCVFSGTAMSSTASSVALQLNGSNVRLSLPTINSTTRLVCVVNEEIVLSAGDAIKLVGSITGTTPLFGDTTWQSYLSIEKIT